MEKTLKGGFNMKKIALFDYCREHNLMDIINEWDKEKNESSPHDVSYGCNKTVWWICKLGHSWQAKIGNRSILKRGCPYCSGSKTLPGFNDFKTWCITNNRQDLIQEWNIEKNEISIDNISPKNNRKVWWKCSLGHEWDATIGSRTNPSRPGGCPYCSKPPKRILVGFNDFESWCKNNDRNDLLTEWDYENNSILPCEVTFGSGKIIWWKCNKAHRWKTAINNRTCGSKTQCPICTRTQTSFPEQAVAFYLTQIFDIFQRYRIKGYEVDIFIPKYKIAIEYDGRFFHDNDDTALRDKKKAEVLAKSNIQLIRIKETTDIFRIENNVIMFPTSNGRYITKEFEQALSQMMQIIMGMANLHFKYDINMSRDELKIRSYYMNALKENSVAAIYPELISEWDVERNNGVDAFAFSAKNNKKVWWKCVYGHSWYATINSRTVRKLGCPFCAVQRTIKGENDLETWCKHNNPQLLSEWDTTHNKELPSDFQKTSNKVVWWVCSLGHRWQASIANRVHGTNCPFCNTGRNAHSKTLSLYDWCILNNYGQLLSEWNYEKNEGKTPKDFSYGSHSKVWWKCLEGHEWEAVIKSRRYNHGCPYCSPTYKKAIIGLNDLVTWCKGNARADLLSEWNYERNNPLKPEFVTKGSHKKVWWICSNGHEWQAEIKARTQVHGNTCPYCKQNS